MFKTRIWYQKTNYIPKMKYYLSQNVSTLLFKYNSQVFCFKLNSIQTFTLIHTKSYSLIPTTLNPITSAFGLTEVKNLSLKVKAFLRLCFLRSKELFMLESNGQLMPLMAHSKDNPFIVIMDRRRISLNWQNWEFPSQARLLLFDMELFIGFQTFLYEF